MSKSSSTSTNKSLPAKSAWSKGPPQTSAPSPRSQSPAPSAQSQSHLTHSRRPSALGQAFPLKDGVSIPRNIGAAAAKQGSAVTFGSIDDASAPISSSPAAAPPTIKETVVRSFGTVPAASNGKASVTSRPPVSTASPSTTATPSTATQASAAPGPAKLDKKDIAKLFQSSPAPSAPSPAETQSPSLRNANLPSQNQPPQTPSSSSQPSQFTPHFQTFVPSRPQPQNSGPNSGPNRSPVYSRQMPNGAGPRPPAPPNGAPSAGISSPRLGPPHVAQQPGPPATPQGPGQPHMAPQMVWNGAYYYPDYVPYPTWGYVPPGMPPQSAHPHPPHMGPPPHMPPHPMSPHTPSRTLQPGTPTMSHAAPNPVHPPHPPPPLSHTNSSMGSVTSPPPTPSSARLNASSSAFVPQQRSRVILKNPEGKEVALETLTKSTAAATSSTAASSGQSSPFRGSSPSTPKRSSIRIESEDQRRKRLEEEEKKQRAQQEAEEKAKREKEEEARKRREEQERKEQERIKAEEVKKEEERLKKEEEERKKREEAEERKKKEEEEKERLRREEEERERREAEEAERARKEAEDKERLRKAEEEEKKAKEEAERKAKEEEERKKHEEDEAMQRADAAKAEQAIPGPAAPTAGPPATKEEGEIQETPAASKDEIKEKVREGLRINTTPTSNPADLGKRRPANLDLSATKAAPIASALATARSLDTLEGIRYPEGISSPKPELNENAKPGRFRYDRDFLLQFKEICKDRPPNLPPLDAIGLEPIDQAALMMSRGGSGRHRGASGPVPSRQSSVGLPFGGPSGLGKSGSGFSGMGNFAAPRMSSEDRFAMSNAANRSASVGGAAGLPFAGRPAAMQRTASQGGQIRERTRSKRGEKRPPADGKGQDRNISAQNQPPLEPVAPLQMTANRWDRKALASDPDSPEIVERKVKGLLNKLTMEKFDSISDQIIAWANKSEKEKDGRTLIQVIRLVFEKATDEAAWSEMYARLCRKMMEQISPKVQDEGIKNTEGKPIAGGQLFRKYLLNRCQEDFERGWAAKDATAAAAAAKAADDEAVKASNASKKEDEVELYSDEYYAASKAKRQGLGLIKFIGELFKLQMLTERIMHECVKKLLGNVENPEEEEIESLCKLLTTVGHLLDTPKAQGHMDIYFSRMEELTKSNKVAPRLHFMLQDVIEMRARKWVSRTAVAAPTTLAQVHENAMKEKAAQERENMQRQMSMSRTSSNRGRGRNELEQPDGWAVAGSRPVPTKAGDLSNFGKIAKGQPISFGPSSVFSKSKTEKRESISRTASSSNMFSMLQNDAAPEPKPEPQRKKLALLPRSVPKPDEGSASNAANDSDSSGEEEEEKAAAPDMSEADAKRKIDEDSKELFAVRNVDEAESYFTALPAKYHHKLVDKLVNTAIESKAVDADLVGLVFERASSKQLCAPSAFEDGFMGIAEFLEDIAIDAPHAYQLFATMVKGAKLSAEAHSRVAEKDTGSKLLPLLS